MGQLTRQAPHAGRSQPPVQADGVQQLVPFQQYMDANGNLCSAIDPWGNTFMAGEQIGMRTITANATGVGADSDGTPDRLVLLNASGLTYTLPTPSALNKGQVITVKIISATSTGTVNGGGANIDGASTYSLSAQFKYVTVVSTGTIWVIIANN